MDPPVSRVQQTDPAYVHKVFSHQTYQPYQPSQPYPLIVFP